MQFRRERCFLILAVSFIFAILLFSVCYASDDFSVVRVGNIITYGNNRFRITSPESGHMIISVHDDICEYRSMEWDVQAGETEVSWDGCGFNREKLYPKTYTITCTLTGDSGTVYTKSFNSPVAFTDQALQYALPSSDTLYLNQPDEWFIEFRTVLTGTVIIEFRPAEKENERISFTFTTKGGRIYRKMYSDFTGNTDMAPGEYTIYVYEVSKPHEAFAFPIHIEKDPPDREPVFITGEIMPDRSMSPQEIWELMMKPSVVIDIDFFDHQKVYERKNLQSRSLGTLHGQTQCLKVIQTEDNWALTGAWNHETAEYIEGWIPLERLKVVKPQTEYGILIDKQLQTLTLFHHGSIVDTLFVSTGRPDEKRLYQESSAGSFLTGYHRVNFSTNGKKYDFVIQYDGGNLLHQTPYRWGRNKKDFTSGRGYLGAKASHACIRIQADPGKSGINAYWLWTHIPYHTRVFILDDPVERRGLMQQLQNSIDAGEPLPDNQMISQLAASENNDVVFTFGGNFIPGATQAAQKKGNSYLSMISHQGAEASFSNLETFFKDDDFTCISLCSPLEAETGSFSQFPELKYAPETIRSLFPVASIEGIQLSDNGVYEQKEDIVRQTERSAGENTLLIRKGHPVTVSIKGRLFGMASCSEQDYLKDPDIIDESIQLLKQKKCERIIMLISWGETKSDHHTIIQEAMARRSVLAGADLVIGSHPHKLQGMEEMLDVPVIYSMGDLLDGSSRSRPKRQYGILVRAVFHFDESASAPEITVIPIKPYGNDPDKNQFIPSTDLTLKEKQEMINMIRNDSMPFSIEQISFYTGQ